MNVITPAPVSNRQASKEMAIERKYDASNKNRVTSNAEFSFEEARQVNCALIDASRKG